MTPLQLRPSSLDEIIFEGRNKAYGAFDLRQHYNVHLRRALALALMLFALLAASPMISRLLWPAKPIAPPVIYDPTIEPQIIDAKPIKPVKPEEIAQPKTEIKNPPMQALPTKVKPDELVQDKPVTVTPPDVMFGPVDMPGDSGAVPNDGRVTKPGVGAPGGTGTETATPAKPEVFVYAEKMPEFEGGAEAMLKFLRKNMRYPAMALRSQVEGKVFVAFTVSSTGDIVDVQVLKGLGYGTDEEALRVVKLMPRWQPGAQNGRNVAVRYTLPITFTVK
ncbi:energy transducer TonB [Hymenobacter gummosus]|nr:energy transducer TonB [Hymenobacter gummosus]